MKHNPIALLPSSFRRFIATPMRLVPIWALLALGLLALPPSRPVPLAPSEASSDASPAAATDGAGTGNGAPSQITIRGSVDISIAVSSHLLYATQGGSVIAVSRGGRVPGTLEAREDGTVVHRLEPADGSGKFPLTDGIENRMGFLRKTEEGFVLESTDGSVLHRVKVKEDKFNVYDAGGVRIRKGKLKRGIFVVTDASDTQVLSVDFGGATPSFVVAGALSLPGPLPIALLVAGRYLIADR